MTTAQAVKGGKQAADFEAQLAERTADLQRLQAEYANYRKRVDRDRAAVREQAVAATLAGLPFTPAIDNLIFAVNTSGAAPTSGPGAPTLEEMIASTGRALLLTCLWYIREVDPQVLLLTGLTRDGVYLVEDGEVVGAVNNFRFNESPVGMLGRLLEVGATVPTLPREWGDYFNRAAMPPVRVEGFNMSSVSQAS